MIFNEEKIEKFKTDPFEIAVYKSVEKHGHATVRDVRKDTDYVFPSSVIAGVLRILCRKHLIKDSGLKDHHGTIIWTLQKNNLKTLYNF